MEYIRCGRVVYDDRAGDGPAELGEILDVVPAVVVAGLAEEPVRDGVGGVDLVEDGVCVLSSCVSTTPYNPQDARRGSGEKGRVA